VRQRDHEEEEPGREQDQAGLQPPPVTQNVLTLAKVIGLFSVLIAGLIFAPPLPPTGGEAPPAGGSFGLAMVFVLLTFGGWNEAAYISAELHQGAKIIFWALSCFLASPNSVTLTT